MQMLLCAGVSAACPGSRGGTRAGKGKNVLLFCTCNFIHICGPVNCKLVLKEEENHLGVEAAGSNMLRLKGFQVT